MAECPDNNPSENMNIDGSESELSDGVSARTTEPEQSQQTTEDPVIPSKKYKRGFKHQASDRRAYDRKNLKSLDKKEMIVNAIECELMARRKFSKNDFLRNHPGGSLGKKLLTEEKK